MKIIYVHHAERNRDNNLSRELQDITTNGIKDAELLSEIIKKVNIKAIYTSSYIRCKHTSEIINRYNKVPIIEESRFNEMNTSETWVEFLKRNMFALDDIVKKYDENDTIICVTSGVNLSAFICYSYNIEPSGDTPCTQGVNCSPINFYINTNKID